ncbi:hypothetical protein QN277_004115 [Acacia crassicarpa]|uniref:MYB transcription factor n=1 Tax=Acacia crassicarpa TaxID=499986 RepID=A0AAE1JXB1_9FABA|nr:hypothetical protein QN277_004115 [Acacia crassicarpa]
MVKSGSRDKQAGLKKGPWTPEEDQKLMYYIQLHGQGSWSSLPAKAGLRRSGKSCRLRWINYLRPDIKRGKFSLQEDQTIIQLHALLGNKWSAIAHHLPKRTDNEIKNYWNTCLKKRLTRMGISPNTHKPINNAVNNQSKDSANLNHTVQWETARLEAEARQFKEYRKLQLHQNQLSSSSSSSQPSLTRLVLNKVTPRPSRPPCLDILKAWYINHSLLPSKQNAPKMRSMYAMMLATDDLEFPASTLSFPDTVPTNSKCSNNNNNTFGMINQSLLPSSFTSTATNENAIAKGVCDDEACGNKVGSLGNDGNIMVAVEAFRSSGYSCNSVAGLYHDDVLAYGFNENSASSQQNLGVISVGNGSGSDNFEGERQDWEAILELANGLPSSPVFPVL